MEPNHSEKRVIAAAEEMARTLGEDPNHTVASAAMDTRGTIHTGVNVYHFTGGPCAELVVLGAAPGAQAGPLVTIAAAGDQGRGVIPPCGRCRQALLDLHPDVCVAVRTPTGPQMRPIHDLLPGAFIPPDSAPERIVRFNKRYYDAVATGEKTSTLRYAEPISTGPAIFYFEDDQQNRTFRGTVTGIQPHQLTDLSAEQRNGLRQHYPDLCEDAEIDLVEFSVHRQGSR